MTNDSTVQNESISVRDRIQAKLLGVIDEEIEATKQRHKIELDELYGYRNTIVSSASRSEHTKEQLDLKIDEDVQAADALKDNLPNEIDGKQTPESETNVTSSPSQVSTSDGGNTWPKRILRVLNQSSTPLTSKEIHTLLGHDEELEKKHRSSVSAALSELKDRLIREGEKGFYRYSLRR